MRHLPPRHRRQLPCSFTSASSSSHSYFCIAELIIWQNPLSRLLPYILVLSFQCLSLSLFLCVRVRCFAANKTKRNVLYLANGKPYTSRFDSLGTPKLKILFTAFMLKRDDC